MLSFLLRGPPVRLCMGLACVLSLWNTVSGLKRKSKKEKERTFSPTADKWAGSVLRGEERKEREVAFLATTELPARSVDLSALNLTELVNGMLSRGLKESKRFFSLLSITSYSSFAFHKVSVAIYNISNPKTVDPAKFHTRYCYCLNNRTNDLSDFTALLVDIIGNSTSYLTEIFKSTSILSVSQTNESDCIFICVMAGKSGRNLSDFWVMAERPPVINYTFTSNAAGTVGAATREAAGTSKPTTQSQRTLARTRLPHWALSTPWTSPPRTFPLGKISSPSEGEAMGNTERFLEFPKATATWSSAFHTLSALATVTPGTQTPNPTKAPAPREPQTGDIPVEWPLTPTEEPVLVPAPHQVSRCPQLPLKEGAVTAAPLPLAIQKLNLCLMELCRFFQQCLCVSQMRDPSSDAMRYCLEYYSWFLKNATLICQRVKRVSHSRTLKQKCLENVCKSV
ncbi:HERV-H LTR-associating protein 1 [Castor canadensis]|uniref:HERV-H LTR-associating protein 1 n=1 Tax=Castor canadensis TaxID=51338 RepID=A0A8B7VVZ3_CASCN|nr:HERV-H LTR-associating protein 1 [Castor canadensis]